MPFLKHSTSLLLLGVLSFAANLLVAEEPAPQVVDGVALVGTKACRVKVTVRNREGALNLQSQPAIAVLKNSPWSPDDPVRDGAREFEVLLTVGSLLRNHPLGGVVGVGNKFGRLMAEAEQALTRSAVMGVPVVKVAAAGGCSSEYDDNLFVEAGSLSADAAKELLAQCMLRLGALPPAADASHPTEKELAAIKAKVAQYQVAFNNAARPLVVASR